MARDGGAWRYRATRWVLRQLGLAYFGLAVTGLEHLPEAGPAIVAGNHPNVLDGILLLIVSPRPVRFLVAEELLFHRILHPFFTAFGCIPVYRTRDHNGDALRAAVEALERGEVLGIFPEGTTADLGQMRIMKRGVGLLARRTGAPVVPCGIVGTAELYPQGTRAPRPGRIAIAFLPAQRFARVDADQIPEEVLRDTLAAIRRKIVRAIRRSGDAYCLDAAAGPLRGVQVALSALIVLPLTALLTLTASPSLGPAAKAA